MKIRTSHKTWFCFSLILMILLSGMCYEFVRADSLLRCLHTRTMQGTYQVEEAFLDAAQNEVTEEVFGVRNLNVHLSVVRRTSLANGFRGLWLPYLLLLSFLYHIIRFKRLIIISAMKSSNQQMIIYYIHQKDGAKG